jgi:5'-3' exonuclease
VAGQLTLLDAPSLWYRAFHGVPESVTAPDGSPVNAVRGTVDLIARIVKDTRPARLVACLDLDWRPAFRVAAVPSYKAHRLAENGAEAEPESLAPQVAVLLEVLDAVGSRWRAPRGTRPTTCSGRCRRARPVRSTS